MSVQTVSPQKCLLPSLPLFLLTQLLYNLLAPVQLPLLERRQSLPSSHPTDPAPGMASSAWPAMSHQPREGSTVGRAAALRPQLGISLCSTLGAQGTSALSESAVSSPGVLSTWIACCHPTITGLSETCSLPSATYFQRLEAETGKQMPLS